MTIQPPSKRRHFGGFRLGHARRGPRPRGRDASVALRANAATPCMRSKRPAAPCSTRSNRRRCRPAPCSAPWPRSGRSISSRPRSAAQAAAGDCRRRCRTMRWGRGAGSGAACNGGRSKWRRTRACASSCSRPRPERNCRGIGTPARNGLACSMARSATALGRYGAGDFDEADESVEHDPVVDAAIRLRLSGGAARHIELQGWLGRLIAAVRAHLSGRQGHDDRGRHRTRSMNRSQPCVVCRIAPC